MRTNLECALTYAGFGWNVFPCYTLSKIPIPANGFRDATTDAIEIKAMWEKNPDANVAIHIPKEYIVADIDNFGIAKDLGPLPDTIRAATPRAGGGMHLWYRLPSGVSVTRTTNFMDGFDLLTTAGYIVAPNSIHPSGYRYRWVVPPRPDRDDLGIADCPEWLIKMALENEPQIEHLQSPRLDVEHILYNLKVGERQQQLFRLACSLRGRNVLESEARALLEIAAQNANPPYTEKPVADIVTRVYSKYSPNKTTTTKSRKIWRVSDLVKADVGEVQYFVESLLPQGFTLFSSDPKMGKSMILANMARDIALGRKALGKYETNKCGILYLDLEQEEIMAKPRWVRILKDHDTGDFLHTVYSWDPIDHGGLKEIEDYIRNNSYIKIIIIDILQRIWPAKELIAGTQYQKDYAVISKLTDLAKKYGIAIIGVHHNTKNNISTDFIKSASGSMGMTAASDTIWSLERARNNDYAQLKITGKNIKEGIHYLQSYNEGFSWYAA